VAPHEALEVWTARGRWPHLYLGGVHVHVGSQLLDPVPLQGAVEQALALARAAAERGAALGWLNLGGGFGVDEAGGAEFPLERHAKWLAQRLAETALVPVETSPVRTVGEPDRHATRGRPIEVEFVTGRYL